MTLGIFISRSICPIGLHQMALERWYFLLKKMIGELLITSCGSGKLCSTTWMVENADNILEVIVWMSCEHCPGAKHFTKHSAESFEKSCIHRENAICGPTWLTGKNLIERIFIYESSQIRSISKADGNWWHELHNLHHHRIKAAVCGYKRSTS